ncbi:MAG: hypothetical protein FJ278_18725 [Planctomycetes bacterium]|nr:hypothetical protein [Planctomycetota bacterium]
MPRRGAGEVVWEVLGFRVQGSGFTVQGSGFTVQGLGFTVQGLGFTVQGLIVGRLSIAAALVCSG